MVIICSIKVYILYLLTYLLNIDIDVGTFRQYRINIVSKSKK